MSQYIRLLHILKGNLNKTLCKHWLGSCLHRLQKEVLTESFYSFCLLFTLLGTSSCNSTRCAEPNVWKSPQSDPTLSLAPHPHLAGHKSDETHSRYKYK